MDEEPPVSEPFEEWNGLRPGTWELTFVNDRVKVVDVQRFIQDTYGGPVYAIEKETNKLYNWRNVISAMRVGS